MTTPKASFDHNRGIFRTPNHIIRERGGPIFLNKKSEEPPPPPILPLIQKPPFQVDSYFRQEDFKKRSVIFRFVNRDEADYQFDFSLFDEGDWRQTLVQELPGHSQLDFQLDFPQAGMRKIRWALFYAEFSEIVEKEIPVREILQEFHPPKIAHLLFQNDHLEIGIEPGGGWKAASLWRKSGEIWEEFIPLVGTILPVLDQNPLAGQIREYKIVAEGYSQEAYESKSIPVQF